MEALDKLSIETDPKYTKQLDKDEVIMFSEKVKKINRHGIPQDRILVLSTTHLYVFK